MTRLFVLLVALCISSGTRLASAAENPVQWTFEAVPQKPLRAGSKFTSKLIAHIQPGWHLYAMGQEEGGPIATEISLADDSVVSLLTVREPKPIALFDSNFGKRLGLYVDSAEFTLPFVVSAAAAAGGHQVVISARYQCCNDTMCLQPKTVSVALTVAVKSR